MLHLLLPCDLMTSSTADLDVTLTVAIEWLNWLEYCVDLVVISFVHIFHLYPDMLVASLTDL